MNNLLKFPGIVCQGDDGGRVREPKQTVSERGSVLSTLCGGGGGAHCIHKLMVQSMHMYRPTNKLLVLSRRSSGCWLADWRKWLVTAGGTERCISGNGFTP